MPSLEFHPHPHGEMGGWTEGRRVQLELGQNWDRTEPGQAVGGGRWEAVTMHLTRTHVRAHTRARARKHGDIQRITAVG